MQWKTMDWPVMVDSLDLIQIGVVPLTLGIDEHGIIRHVGLRPAQASSLEETFLEVDYPAPASAESEVAGAAATPTTADGVWREW